VKLAVACVLLAAVVSSPCAAYLYDCGPANYAGAIVKLGTSTERVAEPFAVQADAYATQFGAALGRAYGPVGAGFTVDLTTWSNGEPGSIIESWTVVPTVVSLDYYYFEPTAPIALAGIGSGAYYALVFTPNQEGFAGAVSYTAKAGCYYGHAWNTNSGWFTMQYPLCIRVDGYYAVPEPGCMGTLACGLIAFGLRRRRL
jgi:hypothetical protein